MRICHQNAYGQKEGGKGLPNADYSELRPNGSVDSEMADCHRG